MTVEQRYQIFALKRARQTQKGIAGIVGVSESTISRELKRNSYLGTRNYYPSYADRKARERWNSREMPRKMTGYMKMTIQVLIKKDYSPEQVVGYCRRHGLDMVSHETIYRYIWADKRGGGDLYRHLRRHGRKYRRRGCGYVSRGVIAGRAGIWDRPPEASRRDRVGDYEIDTIVGRTHSQHMLTIVDRASRRAWARKLLKPTAAETARVLIETLRPLQAEGLVKTITSDNGIQFADHKTVSEQLHAGFFFARPYHSWERGTNENTNGLFRQYIPKGTDFDCLSDQDLLEIEDKLNTRPRKTLGFLSPLEYFDLLTKQDSQVAFRG